MIHRNLKQMAMALIASYTISACSEGELAGGGGAEKKDPKKKRTESETTQDSETSSSNDASQPQVVTGAYLACIENGTASAGSTNFGCTVTNEKDHKKMDLKGKTLNITAADPSGQSIQSKFNRDADSSVFHGHVSVASGAASTAKFTAQVDGKEVKDLRRINLEWRNLPSYLTAFTPNLGPLLKGIIQTGQNGDFIDFGKKLKNGTSGYTTQEVSAWCSQASFKSLSNDDRSDAILCAACGTNAGKRNIIKEFLNLVPGGDFKTGICENPAAVGNNYSTFSANCKNP
ncbi:MAG: hypothetical protein NT027_05220 [Proteobacteria bacterium]|nr:hypothetical protein [Pseudomonadota bacterium]